MEREERPAAAHRPSRRHAIVSAAVRVFARQGFADASIQAVAAEAGVAPTAVYYHFAGKDDLFNAALRLCLDSVTAVAVEARPDEAPADAEGLARTISAVFEWLDTHPEERQLLHHHLPFATRQARELHVQFERFHVQRAFDYLTHGRSRNGRSAVAQNAVDTLAVRTLVNLTLMIHPMRSEDAPLAKRSRAAVERALQDVSQRIVTR